MKSTKKKKSRFGKGLLAGAIFGLAAGIFMSSKEGKNMANKLQKRSKEIETKLRNEFRKKKTLTEDAYEESIDTILAYYLKSKQIAKSELPALRRYLLSKWKLVKSEMKDVKQRTKRTPAKKKRTRRR